MDKRKLSGAYPSDMFKAANAGARITDQKFETKPVGYFKDAWMRFKKNKASVTAAAIILFLFIWALLAPVISPFTMQDVDGLYASARPKIAAFERSGFWDGGVTQTVNDSEYIYNIAKGIGAESPGEEAVSWEEGLASRFNPVISESEAYDGSSGRRLRDARMDSYILPGFAYVTLNTIEEFDEIRAWEEETGLRVIYPLIDTRSMYMSSFNANDANFWYRHNDRNEPLDENNDVIALETVSENGLMDNYLRDSETGEVLYYRYLDMTMINIRVLYYNYYQYKNGREPMFVFGADAVGYDLMVRMASGTVLSLGIAFSVSLINLTIGAYLGAVQGYFGGWIDLILQRITEIIGNFPFYIIYVLIAVHWVNTGKLTPFWGLIVAFVIAGWIGTSRLVRMQFYRFKNQEYVLAARTLGAKDNRLMFKHILPNAIGTIITSSILVIPGVIFQESTLSYLGLINFNSATITSLGTMLSNARGTLAIHPHIMFFPAIVISLLMISFNLFGNGLRDAFNPSLRGSE